MLNTQQSQEIHAILDKLPSEELGVIESLLNEKDHKIILLEKELNWFKEQFKLSQQRKFGRSTEKSEALQIELLFNEEQVEESSTSELEERESISYTRRKAKRNGRNLDTSKLTREIQVHDLPEAEKVCQCGCHLEKIGEDVTEQVDHIREQLKVIEHIHPKYVCRHCENIKAAKKPESPLPKCMATAGLITDVIIKKYEQHLPLYRQSKIYASQGLEIPDNTLGNWVMGAAEVLLPLKEASWQQLTLSHVLQVDETPVKVLSPSKEGYMWAYHSCDPKNRFILFEFSLTRSSEKVNQHLKSYQGLLQTDGYSGYNNLRNRTGIINFGCWDHARRRFAEVVKISGNNKLGKAGEMLNIIAKLYEVENETKDIDFAKRREIRQKKSKPILELIYERLQKINGPPQSTLGKAVQYSLNQWPYLIRYIDYGEVEISNCWIENQIRPFALGRRNWLFVGNEQSANKSALLYSLIQSCKLNHIEPRKYLKYVLNQAHRMRRKEIAAVNLLPQFIDKNLLN
jgi:transposase